MKVHISANLKPSRASPPTVTAEGGTHYTTVTGGKRVTSKTRERQNPSPLKARREANLWATAVRGIAFGESGSGGILMHARRNTRDKYGLIHIEIEQEDKLKPCCIARRLATSYARATGIALATFAAACIGGLQCLPPESTLSDPV